MALIITKDKMGLTLPSLNLTKAQTDAIAAVVAAAPAGRINPWYRVTLNVLGINRATYVKVVNGQYTELQYLD